MSKFINYSLQFTYKMDTMKNLTRHIKSNIHKKF